MTAAKSYGFVLLAALACFSAQADPLRFVGYVSGVNRVEARFVLVDPNTRESSGWLRLGQEWHHRIIKSFDPKSDRVVVVEKGTTSSLQLQDSPIARGVTPFKAAFESELIQGTFSESNGHRLFSPDAILRIGSTLVSADRGQMEFTPDGLRGDLVLDTPERSIIARHSILKLNGSGSPVLTAQTAELP